jgi:hypothetical protein
MRGHEYARAQVKAHLAATVGPRLAAIRSALTVTTPTNPAAGAYLLADSLPTHLGELGNLSLAGPHEGFLTNGGRQAQEALNERLLSLTRSLTSRVLELLDHLIERNCARSNGILSVFCRRGAAGADGWKQPTESRRQVPDLSDRLFADAGKAVQTPQVTQTALVLVFNHIITQRFTEVLTLAQVR